MLTPETKKESVASQPDTPATPEALAELERLEQQVMAEEITIAKMEIEAAETKSREEDQKKTCRTGPTTRSNSLK